MIHPISKYTFTNGGEYDINANYQNGGKRMGRLSLRMSGDNYEVYVKYHGSQKEEVLHSSKDLDAVCKLATKLDREIYRRIYKDDSDAPEYVAVPDDIADDFMAKSARKSDIALGDYYRKYLRGVQ